MLIRRFLAVTFDSFHMTLAAQIVAFKDKYTLMLQLLSIHHEFCSMFTHYVSHTTLNVKVDSSSNVFFWGGRIHLYTYT